MEDFAKESWFAGLTYKTQLVQELKRNEHQARRTFGDWAQNEMAFNLDFHNKICLALKLAIGLISS